MSGDSNRWVLHVDLDQFIAAVEVLRRPELAGRPVIVGGRGDPTERAVVSTASYEAREFGVGSGMPLRIAARKAPEAVILPVDAPTYNAASREVMTTLRDQPGAIVQVLGWDEASLPAGMAVAVSDSRLIGHYPSVVADQVQGTLDATRHLLELGHATVHHIAGPTDSEPALVRSNTWQRCLEEAGIRPPKLWQGDWTAASGYEAGRRIAEDESITAVYAANDEMAFGLMRALYERGHRVPDDVSVVGFDGIALSEFASPPLTTVKQDFTRIGHELMRLVLEQIHSKSARSQGRVVVPTELIIRGTTAPPRR